ncbi:MAG: hypothetical protein IPL32_20485 [Chloracidobacterium sp.]|nr:hypothetical protein [Chloracidobacterium sp.]
MIGKTEVVGGVTSLSHGWSHSVTTVLYGFNRVGQLSERDGADGKRAKHRNVRTPRHPRRGWTDCGDTLSNGRLDNEAAFAGVMVDGDDTSDTNRNGSQDEGSVDVDMDADQATLSETVKHVCDHFGSSAGGEERE